MSAADVRARRAHALELDLIGLREGDPQIAEILAVPPSRWYLNGFIVPWGVLARELQRLTAEGIAPSHIALLLHTAAEAVEARILRETAAELVWTGPEAANARCRDTVVVLDELFSVATRSVVLSTYVIQDAPRIFAGLGARLDANPSLLARLFVNIERRPGDTRVDAALLGEYANHLAMKWPGTRRPEVYYDPRSLAMDESLRASWHGKWVVVDDRLAFVTSAWVPKS